MQLATVMVASEAMTLKKKLQQSAKKRPPKNVISQFWIVKV